MKEIEKPVSKDGHTDETHHDKFAEIPVLIALSIRNWILENYHNAFTIKDVNAMFAVSLTEDELFKIYKGDFVVNYPKFSYYPAPVTTTIPTKEADLVKLYQAITGNYYKKVTEQYRVMEAGKQKATFKITRFDHVTFSGIFSSRKADGLIQLSGYAVFDFDHVQDPEVLKNLLIADPFLEVQMIFMSPSGDGLKMILFNEDGEAYQDFYGAVVIYLKIKYPMFAASLDAKTKDIARTCFICHDANCYINPQYLELWQASKN